ncbi:SPFH/Band 7/PHB domain protein, partial [Candidatus Parcubacteria bacterium]|nr:SPFH/Band 7/PHB domain protein [Candidatus Parcubacteria bacterium]
MRTIIMSPLFIIKQYELGIYELFGKYQFFAGPGLKFMLPFIHTVRIRDVREHTMDIPSQSVITKDNVEIVVDGIIWAKPRSNEEDIKRTFYSIDNWKNAIMELSMTNLRQEFGSLTLDESLISREKISSNLQKSLDELTNDWGIHVSKVEIRSIDPPADIKNAMHKQKTAEQERRSMKLLATGKFEAAEQEKLAAIQVSEGEQQAKINIAQGQAEAIKLVNESAEKYFKGNAVELKKLEVTEKSLQNNSKVVLTEKGISPQIIIGDIPVNSRRVNLNNK